MGKRDEILLALDIGNVCVRIDPRNFPAALGLEALPGEVRELFRRYEHGEIDDGQFLESAGRALGGRFAAEELAAAFDSILIEAVPGMSELAAGFPLLGVRAVFFSDISPRHLRRTEALFPAFRSISGGVFSFDAGGWKPSAAMFDRFERLYGVPDLYTDDRAELIEAARKRGWRAEVFVSAADLRKKLADLS